MNRSIPTYALYGEFDDHLGADWLHCETIPERSRLHDFRIKPHRHEILTQILHLQGGQAEVMIDGRIDTLVAPGLVIMPPLVVHGFSFSDKVEGLVVTLFERRVADVLRGAPDVARMLETPRLLDLDGQTAVGRRVADGLGSVFDEYRRRGPSRLAAIEAHLALVLIAAHRVWLAAAPAAARQNSSRALDHLAGFRRLVEQDFARHVPIAVHAGRLGLTAAHLNRLCRQHLGDSALGIVNGRIMLEAKRALTFTSLGVKEIALSLGFDDPAYFTRFFSRHSGLSPMAFRARQQE